MRFLSAGFQFVVAGRARLKMTRFSGNAGIFFGRRLLRPIEFQGKFHLVLFRTFKEVLNFLPVRPCISAVVPV